MYDHAPINSGVIVHDDYKLAEKRVPSCSELCFIAAECGGCREEGVCVSCVEKKKGTLEECTVQEGVEKDECEVRGACVHPAGNIEYGLTEAECKGAQVFFFSFIFLDPIFFGPNIGGSGGMFSLPL